MDWMRLFWHHSARGFIVRDGYDASMQHEAEAAGHLVVRSGNGEGGAGFVFKLSETLLEGREMPKP